MLIFGEDEALVAAEAAAAALAAAKALHVTLSLQLAGVGIAFVDHHPRWRVGSLVCVVAGVGGSVCVGCVGRVVTLSLQLAGAGTAFFRHHPGQRVRGARAVGRDARGPRGRCT